MSSSSTFLSVSWLVMNLSRDLFLENYLITCLLIVRFDCKHYSISILSIYKELIKISVMKDENERRFGM